MTPLVVRYFGWSGLSVEWGGETLLFDPFWRRYCGAQWFGPEAFARARVVCLTHGHEEHFLDAPAIIRGTGATAVGSPSLCAYLRWVERVPRERLVALAAGASAEVGPFRISTFLWKHRDINLWKALSKAVFEGNATQLSWAFSSATRAPFYSPYTGFHVELPDGATVLNYNEGFNSTMTDAEIAALGHRFRTDVLLAGMQLDFVDDVARGAAALRPKVVLLYKPHEHFHAMMGATSRPWAEFIAAVRRAVPEAQVIEARPGLAIDGRSGAELAAPVAMRAA